jgi:hypothetical protein
MATPSFSICFVILVLGLAPAPGYTQTGLPAPAPDSRASDGARRAPGLAAAVNSKQPFGLTDNMELVYRLLDANGKTTGELRQRVVQLKQQEREEKKKQLVPENTALLKSGLYDKQKTLEHLQDLTFRARRDTCFTDGMAYVNFDALRSFRDRKTAYEAVPLAWPNQPTAGSELPPGGVTVKVSSSMVDIASVSTTLRNRRVLDGPKPVTTPAGTFSCYQVEAEREEATVPRPDMALRTMLRQVDFYAPNVGIVRTELYDKKGKLSQVCELTSRSPATGPKSKSKTSTKSKGSPKVKYKTKKS